jgi:hypothetical protein
MGVRYSLVLEKGTNCNNQDLKMAFLHRHLCTVAFDLAYRLSPVTASPLQTASMHCIHFCFGSTDAGRTRPLHFGLIVTSREISVSPKHVLIDPC